MTRAFRKGFGVAIAALGVMTGFACDGDDGGGDASGDVADDGGYDVETVGCTRSEALLAERHDCLRDEDCPCGAYCELGLCAHDCLADPDCGTDERCDDFGRCRSPASVELVAPAPMTAQGVLEIGTTDLTLYAAGSERVVRLTARERATGPVRIQAGDGLQVRCLESASFADECAIEDIAPTDAGSRLLRIRYAGAMPADVDELREVTVHASGTRRVILVRLHAASGAPETPPSAGVYRGYAWPVGAGLSSRAGVDPLPEDLARMRMPVTATVYPGAGGSFVVTFADELRAIFPESETVGRLNRVTADDWTVEVGARHYLGPETPSADQIEVTVRGTSDEVVFGGGRFDVLLRTVFDGAMLPAHSPFTQWRIALTWVAALPAGAVAPPLPAPYAPGLDPSRAADPSTVETSALAVLPPVLGATASERAQAALCTDRGVLSFVSRLRGEILLVEDRPVPTGDLACGDTPADPPLTLPLHTQTTFATNSMIGTCLGDLERAASAPTVLTTDGCVDAARLWTGISLAIDTDRRRALGTASAPEPAASALAHRLLQQWIGLYGFLARESAAVQAINDILPEAERVDQAFAVVEATAAALRGWDALLHPRIAAGLAVMPPAVLLAPDYRPRLFPGTEYPAERSHEQPVGLSVTILRGLRSQLGVLAGLVENARTGAVRFADVEPLLVDALRRGFVVLAIAQGLYDAARTVGEPGWQAEWDDERGAYGTTIERILRAVDDYHKDVNILGISDEDLPIYRVGDEISANDRLSALSDYLLGVGTDFRAVAPWLTARAQTALDAARASWVANLERNWVTQLESTARSRRIEGINRRYGEQICGLCGDPACDAAAILSVWNSLDPTTCYIKDECRLTEVELRQRITSAEVGYGLCVLHRLRARLGSAVSSGNARIDGIADAVGPAVGDATRPFDLVVRSTAGTSLTFTAGTTEYAIPYADLSAGKMRIAEDAPAEFVEATFSACAASRDAMRARRPTEAPAACAVADDCPPDYLCRTDTRTCAPDTVVDAAQRPECFRGSMGATAIAVQSAAREIEIARAEIEELTASYDIALQTCILARGYYDQMESALDAHNRTMHTFAAVKLASQVVAHAAAAVKDSCAMSNPFSMGWGVAGAIAEAAALSVVDGMDYAMEEAERAHGASMAVLDHALEDATCRNDATMHLVGMKAAHLRAKQAMLNLAQTSVDFESLKTNLRALLVEGHASVENEVRRRVDPMATDFWLAERVEIYRDYLRHARRAVYLATLATEYEFQYTSGERSAVLSARTPAQLQTSIDHLRAVAMTGTVGGALPANLFTVVSLQGHLLQMADRSAFAEGWHALSPAERFQVWLNSPANAVYDQTGRYLGQEVYFTIQPLGTIGLGDPSGVPILAGTDCAERLWSVNASLVGPDIHQGGGTFTRVVLRKRNTFYSQWCSASGRDTPFQVASTRPSINLFLDPYNVEESMTPSTPQPDRTSVDEVNAYSDARISAYFNVSRAALEDESYFNGDSQELAGRGLYGDYALFFPRETLSVAGSDGLLLNRIEDVLLRLDYVSVARSRP
jgi:hypothetical protein